MATTATVGLIQEHDLPRLAELYAELSPGDAHPLEAMRVTFAEMQKEPGRYFLVGVWEDGELAGSAEGIVCRQLNHDATPFLVMENFVVAEKHRRKGLGRLLLRELERLATENNCRGVLFVSGAQRKAAHAFYESMGYPPETQVGFRKKF